MKCHANIHIFGTTTLWLGYIVGMLILLCCDVAKADTKYLNLVDEADKACADENWTLAAQILQNAIDVEPNNPGNILLLNNLGLVRFNLGLDSLALEAFNAAHKQAPSSVTILANRAKVLTAIGRDKVAMDDYCRIIRLDSTYIAARFNHGLLALRHRMFDVAEQDFEYLANHDPASDEALIGQATLLSSLGKYQEAIPFYTKILDKIKVAEYYGARAYCYIMTGDLQAAATDIATALELSPDDGELYLYRAALNKMHFRPDDARKDAEQAVRLGADKNRAKEFF